MSTERMRGTHEATVVYSDGEPVAKICGFLW